jgi:hypothetical protein
LHRRTKIGQALGDQPIPSLDHEQFQSLCIVPHQWHKRHNLKVLEVPRSPKHTPRMRVYRQLGVTIDHPHASMPSLREILSRGPGELDGWHPRAGSILEHDCACFIRLPLAGGCDLDQHRHSSDRGQDSCPRR